MGVPSWTLFVCFVSVALSGCVADDPAEAVAPAAGEEEPSPDPVPEDPPEVAVETLHFELDGRLETGVRVCDPQAGVCHVARPVSEDQELRVADLRGLLLSGNATIGWTAGSPATEELRAVMRWEHTDCEECEDLTLGAITAASPIVLEIGDPVNMTRPGVLRVYVRSAYAEFVGPLYVQPDLEQDFRLDLALEMMHLGA